MNFLDFLASLFKRKPDPILPAQVTRVAYGKDPAQFIDLYVPARRASQLVPGIVMVHGGGWRRGEADAANVVANKVAYWNPEGYAVVSVSYRLGVDSSPPIDPYTQAQDVAAAFAFLRANGKQHGLDINRVTRMGHSAGAHLVMLVCTHPALAKIAGPHAGSVSLDSAALDVVKIMENPRHDALYTAAFGTDPAYWQQCSPLAQMTARMPPVLLVYSSQRGPANRDSTNDFAAKARSLGTSATVLAEDLSHGEINSTLGLPGAYTEAVDGFLRGL